MYPKQVYHKGVSIPNDGEIYSYEGGWNGDIATVEFYYDNIGHGCWSRQ